MLCQAGSEKSYQQMTLVCKEYNNNKDEFNIMVMNHDIVGICTWKCQIYFKKYLASRYVQVSNNFKDFETISQVK